MELKEFLQLANILDIKVIEGFERVIGEMSFKYPKKYSIQCNGITCTYKNDKNGGYVKVDGPNTKYLTIPQESFYRIKREIVESTRHLATPHLADSYRVETREGLLMILSSANSFNYLLGKENQPFSEMNAKVIAENLRIAQPQKTAYILSNIPTKYPNLRNSLELFDTSINPYTGVDLDTIDYTKYSPALHIVGNKPDNLTSNLIITDLETRTNLEHTAGKEGLRNSLTWFNGDKVANVEHSYSPRNQEETIKIKINADSEIEYNITKREIKKATGIFRVHTPDTLEVKLCEFLQASSNLAKTVSNQCVPTPTPKKRQA